MTLVPNETEQALNRQHDVYAAAREEYRKKIEELAAENERLNKSRNKWGQKYNKLLERHKVTLSQLKAAVWSDSEECKLLTAKVERLREALIDVTASLAATVSLLERGGKKAAPSNTMFEVMLDDYRKSLERALAALEKESKHDR